MQESIQLASETNGFEHESRPLYSLDSLMLGTDILKPADINPCTYQDIIELLQDTDMQKQIAAIRSEIYPDIKKQLKMQLPYFLTGVFKESRKNVNMVQMNAFVLDYDHLENPEYYKEQVISNLDFVQLAFISPNMGLKLYIPLSIPIFNEADFKTVYRYYQSLADSVMKLKSDPTCDPARATFLSYDDKPYQNREVNKVNPETALQLSITQEVKQAVQQHDYLPQGEIEDISDNTMQDIVSATEYCSKQNLSYHDWYRFGMGIKSALGDNGKGLWNLFLDNPFYPDETQTSLNRYWASFNRVGKITYKTIFYIARKYGWKPPNRPLSPNAKLADFPELLELFGKHVNVPLIESNLPDFMQEYLNITTRITDAQAGARLSALLPVLAVNIGNKIYMKNSGTKIYCNIWSVIIGPSSISRKTTAINLALKVLKPYQTRLASLSAKDRNEQDIVLSRATQARLMNLLGINPNRMMVHMEMSAWMQEMNKPYNGGMRQDLTDMFDGYDKPIAKMDVDEFIRKPAFSIIGATTEQWFFRELKEAADQRGGFLQRFIICMIQDVDIARLNLDYREGNTYEHRLNDYDERLEVFRSLRGSHALNLSKEAIDFRNAEYRSRIEAASKGDNDQLMSYFTRIYDGYLFRFSILIHAMQNWIKIKEHLEADTLDAYFEQAEVSKETLEQALYLCDYYFDNTKPFIASMSECARIDMERKIICFLQKAPDHNLTHSQLLNRSKMHGKDFRQVIESLCERQAIFPNYETTYNNRTAADYTLNPVLIEVPF